jgi:hypothetical protein
LEVVSVKTLASLKSSVAFDELWRMVSSERFLTALGLAWLATPTMFILIGLVFEGRLVPLWRHQARSFIPGDFLLGVTLATGWYLYPLVVSGSIWHDTRLWALALAVGVVLAYVWHTKIEAPNYEPHALKSPTKLYHDFGLYGVFGPLLFMIAVPAVFFTPGDVVTWPIKLVALLSFLGWVGCLVYDAMHLSPEDARQMHPGNWRHPEWITWLFTTRQE